MPNGETWCCKCTCRLTAGACAYTRLLRVKGRECRSCIRLCGSQNPKISALWSSWLGTCKIAGTTRPIRCGTRSSRNSGHSPIIRGSFCKPALGPDSSRCAAIRNSGIRLSSAWKRQRHTLKSPGWFQHAHSNPPLNCAAYFSMEFGLSEALPIYSGGLGNVAGDQLKSASDLGVPVVGVGLLYQQGYFRQVIEADGSQQAVYPYNDPSQLPILPLRDSTGEWLRISTISR